MDIIQLLPDNVANQIAAGEVIQRPASAVKELLENAIDAQATDIKLYVKDAGKTSIQVVDNGIGMTPADARLCFERHATSKIRVAEDLFALNTKGFRGEALASIAAISQVELVTRKHDAELATRVEIQANKVTSQTPCVADAGTSFTMKNLFYNVPARRNFLKSDSVELRHILDEFHRVALAHPSIHMELHNGNTPLFNLPSANFRQRIQHLFGNKINERLVSVKEETNLLHINGFICKPSGKKNGHLQYFLVNNRFIKSRYLHHAVTEAYKGLLKENEQPEYFINLTIDPKRIDINIHPTKTEIKFEDERSVYVFLQTAIKHSLGLYNVVPPIDFSVDVNFASPYAMKDLPVKEPTYQVDANYNPFATPPSASYKERISLPKQIGTWEALYTEVGERKSSVVKEEIAEIPSRLFEMPEEKWNPQATLLYFHQKYLVTFLRDKLLLIHIARAHQRVLYERFLATFERQKRIASQQLLFPEEVSFTQLELLGILEERNRLERAGFSFEMREASVVFSGVPTFLEREELPDVIREMIASELEEMPTEVVAENDYLAKKLCKSMAVKTGSPLHKEAQQQLIQDLFSCREYRVSPFGQKVYTELSLNEIDNKFI